MDIEGKKIPFEGNNQQTANQNLQADNSTYPVIGNVSIRSDSEGRYNLNDLHSASGKGSTKAPAQWLRNKTAQALINAASVVSSDMQICTSKNGNDKGTYAADVIAIAYAGWLAPEFQIQVNQTFLDYRTGKLQPIQQPLSRKDILLMALESEEKVQRLESDVQVMTPKVKALEVIANTNDSFAFRDAAKMLQERPKDLTSWLHQNKWIYQQLPSPNWLGYSTKTQSGYLEHKTVTFNRPDGSAGVKVQCRITGKGLTRLAKLMAH